MGAEQQEKLGIAEFEKEKWEAEQEERRRKEEAEQQEKLRIAEFEKEKWEAEQEERRRREEAEH